ncbi:MAG: hypothetical protein L3J36_02450 [Rhodobacteraceae bacterium]|nr:hypothetical protein [Paracoccaceae bacterium]
MVALIGALILPISASAQTAQANPIAVAGLIDTACIFGTLQPELELPRSHAAIKAAGLAIVNEGPLSGFYGDPSGTYFISNYNNDPDDPSVSCAAAIKASDLGYDGYKILIQEIETRFTQRFGAHVFDNQPKVTSWIAKHGDGTKTVVTISFNSADGTNIASVAALDD